MQFIERASLKNFKCLRKVSVGLNPLTVLIGPNDSGKSTFLDAIRRFGSNDRLNNNDAWHDERGVDPSVALTLVGGNTATLSRTVDNRIPQVRPVAFFNLSNGPLEMECPGASGDGVPSLTERGAGVPALVDYFLRADRERFDAYEEALRERIDGLEGLRIATPGAQLRRIDLAIDGGYIIAADQASQGVRLTLFFLALTFHPDPPNVILLEEPENGVHPTRLGDFVALLRSITKGEKCGRPAQVIMTTHSPYLLDSISLDEDQVLVFSRNDDGSRTAVEVDRGHLADQLKDFHLGEIWYNRSESALTGRSK